MVRCKVVCNFKKTESEGTSLYFSPVVDGGKENREFFRYTPGGQIMLYTINDEAASKFEMGNHYYMDFSPAS